MVEWREEAISRHHDRRDFDCGSPELNEYLRRHARQNHESDGAKTFVAVPVSQPTRVIGYYSISPGAIEFTRLPAWAASPPAHGGPCRRTAPRLFRESWQNRFSDSVLPRPRSGAPGTPPSRRGTTWSTWNVASWWACARPQYSQRSPARSRTRRWSEAGMYPLLIARCRTPPRGSAADEARRGDQRDPPAPPLRRVRRR